MSRWAQFVALGLGQLGGLQSLRDIVGNLRAQPHKLYHLGVRAFVSRSSLARVNAQQPYTLYEALFGRLLARCQQRAPRHGFRFKNKLYAVDASTIDLCLAAFPWASFRRTKGAIKLHVGVDLAGHLPTFISVTDGKTGDVTVARTWTFPAGSVVVADRAYLDFGWLHQLQQRGVTFVTRLKRNVRYQVVRDGQLFSATVRTGEAVAYVQLFRNGVIEAVDCVEPVGPYQQRIDKYLPSVAYERDIIDSVSDYTRFYRTHEMPTPVLVGLALLNVKGFRMGKDGTYHTGRPIDRDHLILPDQFAGSLDFDAASFLRPCFDQIWNACGYDRSMNYNEKGNWISDR